MQQGLYLILCRFPFYIMHAVSNHSLLNMHSNSSSVSLTQYFFSLSTKEKACEALILLQVVQGGRWEAKQMCPGLKEPRQAEHPQGEGQGRSWWVLRGRAFVNETQLKVAGTTIKVVMHSLLLPCLKFCLMCDHNSLQLLEVSLQHQPVERQQQEIFVLFVAPKKHCKYL